MPVNFVRSFTSAGKLLFAVCSIGACASGGASKKTYVPPNNLTVQLEQETAMGVANARVAYIRNTSSATIVVIQVNVMDCRNVRLYCGITKKNVKIPPFQRMEVLRLEPDAAE